MADKLRMEMWWNYLQINSTYVLCWEVKVFM